MKMNLNMNMDIKEVVLIIIGHTNRYMTKWIESWELRAKTSYPGDRGSRPERHK